MPRDGNRDYGAYIYGSVVPCPPPISYVGHAPGRLSSNDIDIDTNHEISHVVPTNNGNQEFGVRTDEFVERSFLEEAGVVSINEPGIYRAKIGAFVRGSLNR